MLWNSNAVLEHGSWSLGVKRRAKNYIILVLVVLELICDCGNATQNSQCYLRVFIFAFVLGYRVAQRKVRVRSPMCSIPTIAILSLLLNHM